MLWRWAPGPGGPRCVVLWFDCCLFWSCCVSVSRCAGGDPPGREGVALPVPRAATSGRLIVSTPFQVGGTTVHEGPGLLFQPGLLSLQDEKAVSVSRVFFSLF